MKKLWWNRKRICQTWNNWKTWIYLKEINSNFLILQWKEKIILEKWFVTKVEWELDIWYYKFCAFVTEMYALRPINQTKEFFNEFKFKKKAKAYNNEIFKRSLEKKIGRGQRKIASLSWCCLKTANNRLKRSETIKTLKRYDSYNGFRINKTSLYFSNENRVFLKYYNKNNISKTSRTTLIADHSSMVKQKAIFLNWCLGLNKSDDTIYNLITKL